MKNFRAMRPASRSGAQRWRGAVLGLAAVAALLGGCVVQPARPGYGYGYGPGAYVTIAPPPLRVEVTGYAPAPGYFWVGGYWGWAGGRHEWVPGRWEAPRPGYRYEPHHWEREGAGWRLHEGHWTEERRH